MPGLSRGSGSCSGLGFILVDPPVGSGPRPWVLGLLGLGLCSGLRLGMSGFGSGSGSGLGQVWVWVRNLGSESWV